MTILTVIGFHLWLGLAETIRAKRDLKAGTLRQGLFLAEEGLLLRLKPNQCTLLPRSSIQDVDSKLIQSASFHYSLIQIHYQDAHRKSRILDFRADDIKGKESTILLLIRDWIGNPLESEVH